MLYEFKQGIRDYLATTNSSHRTLEDLVSFNRANAAKAMPYFGQEIFEASLNKGDLDSKEYTSMLKRQPEVRNLIDDTLSKYRLDAICGTTSGLPGAIDVLNGDYNTGFYFGSPAASSGYPHITVPMGTIFNLPVGLSFMSTAFHDAELIGLAYAIEQASKKREAPKFISTIIPE